MARPDRFQIMDNRKTAIAKRIMTCGQNVFTKVGVSSLLEYCVYKLGLPSKISLTEFLNFLTEERLIKESIIKMPLEKEVVRYVSDGASAFEVAQSLRGNSYLSHYTALFLHGLTENLPKVIYTNIELRKSNNNNSPKLEQANIDKAFACNMRKSNQIAKYDDVEIYLLFSKNVEQFGVKNFDFNNTTLRVTDMERTLIDVSVRPSYAGGPIEVLKAYKAAKGQISVNRLLATLRKLDYTYPYHQVVGFYLDKAGYDESMLKLVENIGIEYDFYLTYKIKSKKYSDRWRLFFPEGM